MSMSAQIHLAQPAWAALFDTCQPQLLRHLARRLGNAEDARDLCQETWLRIAEATAGGREMRWSSEDAAKAYVFTVANHLAVDRLRRSVVRQDHLQETADTATLWTPDVAEGVSYRQAIAAVDHAVSGFPERMREVFIRHRVHGEKQEAIAGALGISQNTVERDIMQADDCLESALLRWRGGAPEAQPSHGRRTGTRRRRSLGYLLGVAGLVVAGVPTWRLWQHRLLWEATIASAVGQLLTRRLSDGSELRLDADSEVALQYRGHERRAHLQRGAAFFSVVRDEARPFLVRAGAVEVAVLGTRFGVALEADAVLVEVEHGRVQVRPSGAVGVMLGAGERVRVPLSGNAGMALEKQLADAPASWRQGELVFDRDRLDHAMARLQRYSHQPIELDPGTEALRVSGHVRVAVARSWMNGLSASLPVSVVDGPNGAVRILKR